MAWTAIDGYLPRVACPNGHVKLLDFMFQLNGDMNKKRRLGTVGRKRVADMVEAVIGAVRLVSDEHSDENPPEETGSRRLYRLD